MTTQSRRAFLARVAPRDELVNVPELEAEAARVVTPDLARAIAGGDRAAFDRVTFRPRMMVNCLGLDLRVELAGMPLFAPILVGPVADQQRFHPEGELATVRGAGAANAAVVVSSRTSRPLEALAAVATTPLLLQVFDHDGPAENRARAKAAEAAGCRALVVTGGVPDAKTGRPTRLDLGQVDVLASATALPVLVKGITSAEDARAAVRRGARGLVVSTYGLPEAPGRRAPLETIAPVVEAVGERVPVVVDGGFRRGTDIMKALALGARAVLVARPAMWGLAAYGADGVQTVVELLQTELGRVMACCGAPTVAAITRQMIKVHGR